MSFNELSDDIIQRIFYCLLESPSDYLNLASTCKRLSRIATTRVTASSEWILARPIAFNLNLDLVKYSHKLCSKHKFCPDLKWKHGSWCELDQMRRKQERCNGQNRFDSNLDNSSDNTQTNKQFINIVNRFLTYDNSAATASANDDDDEDDDDDDDDDDMSSDDDSRDVYSVSGAKEKEERECCYYHRLSCLLAAKYVTFSSLKFRHNTLQDRGCIKAFRNSFSELKIRALVELELHKCDISLDWLNTILNAMSNIKYLSLDEVSFVDPCLLVEPKHYASRVLKRLSITGDRNYRINDSIFSYFLENFPAIEFDLSGTRLEYHKRIIQRFYPNSNPLDLSSSRPSESILTFPMILLYLRQYRAVIRHFIADKTDITFTSLKRILQDEVLKELQITIRNCPMITQYERSRLAEQVEDDDLARVIF